MRGQDIGAACNRGRCRLGMRRNFAAAEDAMEEIAPAPFAFHALGGGRETHDVRRTALDRNGLHLRSRSIDIDRDECLAGIGGNDLPAPRGIALWSPVFEEAAEIIVGARIGGGATPDGIGLLVIARVDFCEEAFSLVDLSPVVQNQIDDPDRDEDQDRGDDRPLNDPVAALFAASVLLEIGAHSLFCAAPPAYFAGYVLSYSAVASAVISRAGLK
jgi:hypothetical protein